MSRRTRFWWCVIDRIKRRLTRFACLRKANMPGWEELEWIRAGEIFQGPELEIPNRPGAYAVRCSSKGTPIPIARVFRRDTSGILFFGSTAIEAEGLRGRLKAFWRAVNGMAAPHAEGQRYHQAEYDNRGFPQNALEIGWREFDAPPDAVAQELAWFDEYFCLFGELPPLNRRRG